jgi:ADP-heptose:LPS heptosyltransferase
MFSKLCAKSSVNEILVVSLSNIGDVVLTSPVIDVLLSDFPLAKVSAIVGPKSNTLFLGQPRIETILFNKNMPFLEMASWFWQLRKKKFDVIVDLRQSALGLFLPSRWRTPLIPKVFKGHMRLKHLRRLEAIYPNARMGSEKLAIVPKKVPAILNLVSYVMIAPGSANEGKRWNAAGFVRVADALMKKGYPIVFVGDRQDEVIVKEIMKNMEHAPLSLAGSLDLCELAFVVRNAKFVIAHDSAAMHVASYFDVPTIALWGPTDKEKYGPWSSKSRIVYRGKLMASIKPEDVLSAIDQMQ